MYCTEQATEQVYRLDSNRQTDVVGHVFMRAMLLAGCVWFMQQGGCSVHDCQAA